MIHCVYIGKSIDESTSPVECTRDLEKAVQCQMFWESMFLEGGRVKAWIISFSSTTILSIV